MLIVDLKKKPVRLVLAASAIESSSGSLCLQEDRQVHSGLDNVPSEPSCHLWVSPSPGLGEQQVRFFSCPWKGLGMG